MCGFLFSLNNYASHGLQEFKLAFDSFSWRGPDNHQIITTTNGEAILGHHRLSILDPSESANQPMLLRDKKTYLLFNGEIYNHKDLRQRLNLSCKTNSDTETIGEAYLKVGEKVFELLDGMFAIVIYNSETKRWIASRDAFGIKPLYINRSGRSVIIGSEAPAIAKLTKKKPCRESIREWELIRRPLPGYSFFEGIEEVRPGTIIDSFGFEKKHWHWEPVSSGYSQKEFEFLLKNSILSHELSDCENVGLLSGGLDSALIAAISNDTETFYSVGLENNNEFEGARETANRVEKKLIEVTIAPNEIEELWKKLSKLKGEPISLPNEGLIYKVCSEMELQQKVVLTGEGADELLFGYDNIFRWGISPSSLNCDEFLSRYAYSKNFNSPRLEEYFHEQTRGKDKIEFLEDFFYQVHLPGLLRRMDFSSMAASKEARVPFVSKDLISYLYRKPSKIKINQKHSKIPIRKYAKALGLDGALQRKKIGFSAKLRPSDSRFNDYKNFQEIVIGALEW